MKSIRIRVYLGTIYLPARHVTDEDIAIDAIDVPLQSDGEHAEQIELVKVEMGRVSIDGPLREQIKHRYRLVTLEEIVVVSEAVPELPEADVV